MKRTSIIRTGVILVAAIALLQAAYAQGGMGMGKRMGGGFMMNYDASSEQSIEGTITQIDSMDCPGMSSAGKHVSLSTGKEVIDVHLGPADYLRKHSFTVKVGDRVTVIGARTSYNDAPAMLAREVKSGAATISLRNKQGVPKWKMGRMR